mgnify:FL=1
MPRGTTNSKKSDDSDHISVTEEVTLLNELSQWLSRRRLQLRIKFMPGKSTLPLGRQIRKAMAAFDQEQKKPPQ